MPQNQLLVVLWANVPTDTANNLPVAFFMPQWLRFMLGWQIYFWHVRIFILLSFGRSTKKAEPTRVWPCFYFSKRNATQHFSITFLPLVMFVSRSSPVHRSVGIISQWPFLRPPTLLIDLPLIAFICSSTPRSDMERVWAISFIVIWGLTFIIDNILSDVFSTVFSTVVPSSYSIIHPLGQRVAVEKLRPIKIFWRLSNAHGNTYSLSLICRKAICAVLSILHSTIYTYLSVRINKSIRPFDVWYSAFTFKPMSLQRI